MIGQRRYKDSKKAEEEKHLDNWGFLGIHLLTLKMKQPPPGGCLRGLPDVPSLCEKHGCLPKMVDVTQPDVDDRSVDSIRQEVKSGAGGGGSSDRV